MLTRIRLSFLLLLAVFLSISPCPAAESTGATVLVVPNRYTIVQLAFTMAQMRRVKLVAYERVRKTGDLLMHIWDPANREWQKTDVKEYATGTLISDFVVRVIVIGAENTVPLELVTASSWCEQVDSIPSLDIVTLVNALNDHLAFTPREWRRLAKLYGLELRDRNEERRRYGRYGKPGEKREHPVPPGAGQTATGRLPPEDVADDMVIPEPPEEEKGVPVEVRKPEPEKTVPKKTALEKTESKVEQEPLPEDK